MSQHTLLRHRGAHPPFVRAITWLAITGVFLVPIDQLAAQITRDSLPRDFVLSMLHQYYGDHDGEPQLIAGAVPAKVAGRFAVPKGATVEGTMIWPDGTVILGTVAGNADSLEAQFERGMVGKGWKLLPLVHGANGSGGGFQAGGGLTPRRLCLKGEVATLTLTLRRATPFDFKISTSPAGVGLDCLPHDAGPMSDSPSEHRTVMPTLVDPPGAKSVDECFASGSMSESETRFVWTAPLDSLVEHYATQLRDAGWSPMTSGEGVTRTWSRPGAQGTSSTLVLRVQPLLGGHGCWEIGMTISR